MRSEGFETAKERDYELRGVLKHLGDKNRTKRVTRGNVYYDVLYDENGREIGRSCLQKEAVVAPITAAAAPVQKKVVTETAKAVVAEKVVEKAATGGGFKWWWLLPLLLLLLIPFCWKDCGGTTGLTPPPPPPTPTPMEAPIKKAEVIAPPPAPVCPIACGNNSNAIFNIPGAAVQPKVLTRLGTNPEFGYLRDMGKEAFLAQLVAQHKNSKVDREFLDGMFKTLGYANGIADVTADKIISTKITPGVVGNIGAGKNHRSVYARLDVSGSDVEAFKIEGANGCDIHFMKTCGNFFYSCKN